MSLTIERPETIPSGLEHAFAARESGEYAYLLMGGMINGTLAPHVRIQGVAEVMAAGLDPLLNPADCSFAVHKMKGRGNQAALFAHEGSMYLYSLGTASQVNTPEGDNAWMRLLVDFIREFKPRNLHVAGFNRLVRSALFSGELMGAVQDVGTVVRADGIVIDLSTSQGRVLWQTLAMVSDLERESIVQRLFMGVINKYDRGSWILAPESVPPGYHLVDDRLQLDRSQVDGVRLLIGLLANPELSCRQLLDEAGALGLTSPTIQRFHGPQATFADVRRADSKVRSLLDAVPVWRTGIYTVRLPNPFRGVKHVGQLPVLDDPSATHGVVEFPYPLELPSGGWASDELLDAAARRTRSRKQRQESRDAPTGGAAHRRRRVFAGHTTAPDAPGDRFRISGTSRFYTVLRQDRGAQ